MAGLRRLGSGIGLATAAAIVLVLLCSSAAGVCESGKRNTQRTSELPTQLQIPLLDRATGSQGRVGALQADGGRGSRQSSRRLLLFNVNIESSVVKTLRSLPRQGGEDEFDRNNYAYYLMLVVLGLSAVAFGVLWCCCICVYGSCTRCCRQPDDPTEYVWSDNAKIKFSLCFLFTTILVVVACLFCFTLYIQFHVAADRFIKGAVEAATEQRKEVASVVSKIKDDLDPPADIKASASTMNGQAKAMETRVDIFRKEVVGLEAVHFTYGFITAVTVAALTVLGAIGLLVSRPFLILLHARGVWLVAAILWVQLGMELSLALALSDGCIAQQALVDGEASKLGEYVIDCIDVPGDVAEFVANSTDSRAGKLTQASLDRVDRCKTVVTFYEGETLCTILVGNAASLCVWVLVLTLLAKFHGFLSLMAAPRFRSFTHSREELKDGTVVVVSEHPIRGGSVHKRTETRLDGSVVTLIDSEFGGGASSVVRESRLADGRIDYVNTERLADGELKKTHRTVSVTGLKAETICVTYPDGRMSARLEEERSSGDKEVQTEFLDSDGTLTISKERTMTNGIVMTVTETIDAEGLTSVWEERRPDGTVVCTKEWAVDGEKCMERRETHATGAVDVTTEERSGGTVFSRTVNESKRGVVVNEVEKTRPDSGKGPRTKARLKPKVIKPSLIKKAMERAEQERSRGGGGSRSSRRPSSGRSSPGSSRASRKRRRRRGSAASTVNSDFNFTTDWLGTSGQGNGPEGSGGGFIPLKEGVVSDNYGGGGEVKWGGGGGGGGGGFRRDSPRRESSFQSEGGHNSSFKHGDGHNSSFRHGSGGGRRRSSRDRSPRFDRPPSYRSSGSPGPGPTPLFGVGGERGGSPGSRSYARASSANWSGSEPGSPGAGGAFLYRSSSGDFSPKRSSFETRKASTLGREFGRRNGGGGDGGGSGGGEALGFRRSSEPGLPNGTDSSRKLARGGGGGSVVAVNSGPVARVKSGGKSRGSRGESSSKRKSRSSRGGSAGLEASWASSTTVDGASSSSGSGAGSSYTTGYSDSGSAPNSKKGVLSRTQRSSGKSGKDKTSTKRGGSGGVGGGVGGGFGRGSTKGSSKTQEFASPSSEEEDGPRSPHARLAPSTSYASLGSAGSSVKSVVGLSGHMLGVIRVEADPPAAPPLRPAPKFGSSAGVGASAGASTSASTSAWATASPKAPRATGGGGGGDESSSGSARASPKLNPILPPLGGDKEVLF